jgi:DNA-binding HxlR family transcriptional regulator
MTNDRDQATIAFNYIRAQFEEIPTAGISQQMLTRALRALERDGIVTRTIFPTSPPHVEFSLTELGRSMSEPVLAFGEWVRGHLAEFDAAGHRFDQRDGKIERLSGL